MGTYYVSGTIQVTANPHSPSRCHHPHFAAEEAVQFAQDPVTSK